MDSPRFGHICTMSAKTWAPAKVNLFLGVRQGLDERGYHRVTSIMCPLMLSDEIVVYVTDTPGIDLVCDPNPGVSPSDNLAYRAAAVLASEMGVAPQLAIRVSKHIPSQAGLGGGSSDAAAVLRCLAALWDVTDSQVLIRVAQGLGADVPFFLQSQPALLDRYGDVLQQTFGSLDRAVLLVKPMCGVSTPAAYRAFDRLGTSCPDSSTIAQALRSRDEQGILDALDNNLTPAACFVEPQVQATLDWLSGIEGAVARPLLCGSGSACALFMCDDEAAQQAVHKAEQQGLWACATRTRIDAWDRPILS